MRMDPSTDTTEIHIFYSYINRTQSSEDMRERYVPLSTSRSNELS